MRTVTNEVCSEWLASQKIVEAPYGLNACPAPYLDQFKIPSSPGKSSYIIRSLVEIAEPFTVALLHFTDWPLYQPDEMAVITTLRAAHGEQRPLIASPGHFFDCSERDLLIGMFELAICYHWTAYLYFDHRTVALCWEGDLLDFWTFEKSRLASIRGRFGN